MQEALPEKIDQYQILKSLGKGGMGEVFLALDPLCQRHVALKQIRQNLKTHPIMKERFLREARVAAQLTHPSIIPIFCIDPGPDRTYYTMPYVEGETLKQILKISSAQEKEGEIQHPIGASILTMVRIFLSICEAIAYTHSKAIVHRDLKPDNIIVGKYGEVLLLDWGLADFVGKADPISLEEEATIDDTERGSKVGPEPIFEPHSVYKDLTRPGAVPGTLNYIAPERIRGEPTHVGIDIYSLGVILYQILTLRPPFQRSSVKEFRKSMHLEKLTDPIEIAPYRDIPQHLCDIAKRCLCYAVEDRYRSVDEIISEIKNFLEGKPEWVAAAQLRPDEKKDWEFQENVLLTKHRAITRSPDVMEWVSLMISKASFSGNTKIETKLKLSKECQGVGILLGIPESAERKEIHQGYCVWLGKECRLFHNNVEVMAGLDSPFSNDTVHDVCIEKTNDHLLLYIDKKKIFHYISHIPLAGTHLGLLCKDDHFEILPLKVMVGSQNVMVNCLAIPDAFLAGKNYPKALHEYRRISHSFPGRSEGREAIFKGGITLLMQASSRKKKERDQLYLLALDEFSKLRHTPAAPLEYLGKSLVYKATKEIEEEIKCLELCIRKYPKHPLLHLIREHITFRLHETSSFERVPAYHFALLVLRHLSSVLQNEDHTSLILSLKRHMEKLPFFLLAEPDEEHLACQLAFWLSKPITLVEMIETSQSQLIISNACFALLSLRQVQWVEENLHYLEDEKEANLVQNALLHFKQGPCVALEKLSKELSASVSNTQMRCAYFLFDQALNSNASHDALPFFAAFPNTVQLDALHITTCLMQNEWKKAQTLLETYPHEILGDEYSPLFVPMGCFLLHQEGKEIALSHFGGSIDLPHPPTTMLLSYYLRDRITEKNGWMSTCFAWEKIALLKQLILYFHCAKDPDQEKKFSKLLSQNLKKLTSS